MLPCVSYPARRCGQAQARLAQPAADDVLRVGRAAELDVLAGGHDGALRIWTRAPGCPVRVDGHDLALRVAFGVTGAATARLTTISSQCVAHNQTIAPAFAPGQGSRRSSGRSGLANVILAEERVAQRTFGARIDARGGLTFHRD